MADNFDLSKFKIGACLASFKGTFLGATEGNSKLSVKASFYERKCDQSGAQILDKILTGYNITITIPLKHIDAALTAAIGADGKLTVSQIGSSLLSGAGALLLTPVNTADKTALSFPKAACLPDFEYSPDAEKDHVLSLTFEVFADAAGVFMEKITVA